MHTEMARVVVVQDICVRSVLMRLETVSSSLVDTALLASSAGHGNKNWCSFVCVSNQMG